MPSKRVGDQFVEAPAAASVNRIYGIVGDDLSGLRDTIRRHGKIDSVDIKRGELTAGAAAHLTGEFAVCASSCRPGIPHLINGLFDLHHSLAPVLAPDAHIPSEIGGHADEVVDPAKTSDCHGKI